MNKRWVLVYRGKDGNFYLMEPAQGRYTYDTAERARAVLAALLQNAPEDRLVRIWGEHALGTFTVRCVECWPGHNDPLATVYGEER